MCFSFVQSNDYSFSLFFSWNISQASGTNGIDMSISQVVV
jgi:hypothetical protein